ncbi:MAG: hypothetical protein ACKO96_44305, partial [Flammeovirgaceae bacterium]
KMEKIKTAGWFDKVCGFLVQSLDARLLLVFLLLLKFSFNLIEGEYILTKEVYYESYSRDFSDEQVEQIWDVKQKSKFISSTLSVCGFLLLVAINAALLSTILFAFGRSNTIATSFKIVLISSIPYIIQESLKTIWFLSSNDYVLEDVLNFYPGSFYGLLDPKNSSFATKIIVGNLNISWLISMAMTVGLT